jgi:hypothetical protein
LRELVLDRVAKAARENKAARSVQKKFAYGTNVASLEGSAIEEGPSKGSVVVTVLLRRRHSKTHVSGAIDSAQ